MPETLSSSTAPTAGRLGRWLRHVFGTLKFRVVLVAVLSALVAGGISTYYLSRESERVAVMLSIQQQSDDVELAADMLSSKVAQIQNNLRLLAEEVTPEVFAEPAKIEALLLSRPAARKLFETVYVAQPDGQVRASVSPGRTTPIGVNVLDRAYFLQTLSTGQPTVSEPVRSKATGRMVITFTQPLRTAVGDMFGVMVGSMPLGSNDVLPSTVSTLGQAFSTLVVFTTDGLILSHPDDARVLQSVHDEPGLAPVFAEWIGDGRTVFKEGLARVTPGHMVAMAGVPQAQWMIARITPLSAALGPLRASQQRSWAVTVAATVLSALVAAGLIAWMTQPISRLRERAQLLLGGDGPADEGWPRASGEIGELVQAFRRVTQERARAHQAERVMVAQLRAILAHASIGILLTRDSRFELVGRHMTEMLGYSEQELLGQPTRMIYPSDQAFAELSQRVREQMQARGHFEGELQFRRKDGSEFWGRMLGRGLVPGDPAGGTIWIMHDVTEARERQRQLSWSATHDSLTQLVNRKEFETRLLHAMVQFDHRGVCVMFIDLDHFKPINDQAGHAAGDAALRQIAKLLEARVRQSDTTARLGGDEFAVLLPGCSLAHAQTIAEQVRVGIQEWQLVHKGRSWRVGASIGIVELTPALLDVASVLHAADTACYQAKNAGRNQVVTFAGPPPALSSIGGEI